MSAVIQETLTGGLETASKMTVLQLHRYNTSRQQMEKMKFMHNGVEYYGNLEQLKDERNVTRCRVCGATNVLGSSNCTDINCRKPMSIELKQEGQINTAQHALARFEAGADMAAWELQTFVEIEP